MFSPDIIIFSLQEIVSLNAKNILMTGSNKKVAELWDYVLARNTHDTDGEGYSIIAKKKLVGCYVVILVKKHLVDSIS